MVGIWSNGQPIMVTTRGAGNLHLFTYQNSGTGVNIVGATPTTNTGVTRFLISFSHSYFGYAFYWDGPGEAVYSIGTGLQKLPVGRSWNQASALRFGDSSISTLNVSTLISGAFDVGTTTTCYIVPDEN